MTSPNYLTHLQLLQRLAYEANERGGVRAVLPELMELSHEECVALLIVAVGLQSAAFNLEDRSSE